MASRKGKGGDMHAREFEKTTQDELDDILNSALDDLEDDEDFASAGTESRAQEAGDGQGIKAMEDEEEERRAKALQTLLDDFSNPDIADSLEKAFRHLGTHAEGDQLIGDSINAAKAMAKADAARATTSARGESAQKLEDKKTPRVATEGGAPDRPRPKPDGATGVAGGKAAAAAAGGGEFGFGEGGGSDMDRTILRTLEMLSKSGSEMEGQEAAAVEGAGEDVMRQMMGEFEKMGEKEDYNGVMDNIMQQLLSRELMYDPIKQICDKYPEWLATHRERLPPDDYQRYGLQYQSFQRVLAVYETEPDNFPRLMELMQDMQEHGQIPAEIIKELAPGLEFNAEGAPIMPNVGDGMMPNLPGFPSLDGAGGDPQKCCIS